jgi:DNA-binding MarR family transcriptional regulator
MSVSSESPLAKAGVRPPRELVSSPSFLLKRLGFAVRDRVADAFEAAGASAYHYAVLAVLEEGDRETQAAIADALAYDRSYLVGLLDELEERGLIERRRDPADRRRHLVKLTPAGRKALTRFRSLHERVDDEFFAPLSAEERAALHSLLHRLAAYHDPRYAGNGEETQESP